MARVCELCGKGPMHGNNVSHAHNLTKRVWYPNLQRIRVKMPGGSKRLRVCTRCIRSNKIEKAAS